MGEGGKLINSFIYYLKMYILTYICTSQNIHKEEQYFEIVKVVVLTVYCVSLTVYRWKPYAVWGNGQPRGRLLWL